MTTDLHAQVGWSPPRPVGAVLGAAPRVIPQDGQPPPSASPASVAAQATSLHPSLPQPVRYTGLEGQARATVAPPAYDRPSTIDKDVTCGYVPPAQCVSRRVPGEARFRWSAADGATPSGSVSVGSNPAGGTGKRHKFEHSDNLEAESRQAGDLRQCSALPGPCARYVPGGRHQRRKSLLSRIRR
jgi:hypothetical protein